MDFDYTIVLLIIIVLNTKHLVIRNLDKIILYYLYTPHVMSYFGRRSSPALAAATYALYIL